MEQLANISGQGGREWGQLQGTNIYSCFTEAAFLVVLAEEADGTNSDDSVKNVVFFSLHIIVPCSITC
jgi:hypothetical protein